MNSPIPLTGIIDFTISEDMLQIIERKGSYVRPDWPFEATIFDDENSENGTAKKIRVQMTIHEAVHQKIAEHKIAAATGEHALHRAFDHFFKRITSEMWVIKAQIGEEQIYIAYYPKLEPITYSKTLNDEIPIKMGGLYN